MSRTLLVLRHAKSARPAGVPDHDRPLSRRGKRDASRLGRELAARQMVPELVLSSTAKRARGTARRVLKALGSAGDGRPELRRIDEPLLYLSPVGEHLCVLSSVDEPVGTVLLVGHNPTLEELVQLLTGCGDPMPTGCLVSIALPIEAWSELGLRTRGELQFRWVAKQL